MGWTRLDLELPSLIWRQELASPLGLDWPAVVVLNPLPGLVSMDVVLLFMELVLGNRESRLDTRGRSTHGVVGSRIIFILARCTMQVQLALPSF